MTGGDFVKLCYTEKENAIREYFSKQSKSEVADRIRKLLLSGVDKDELYELINMIMTESYYTLLLGLDGEASLGGKQITYHIYDENGNLLNKCGEIEENAYLYFMEE